MKAIKYKIIKRNAVREFYNRSGGENSRYVGVGADNQGPFLALIAGLTGEKITDSRELLQTWIDKGISLIENWDVRRVKKLIELFPSCVPASYQKMRCIQCHYDEKGEWLVVFLD